MVYKNVFLAMAVAVLAGCTGMKPDPPVAERETHTLVTANLIDSGYAQTAYPAPQASAWQDAERKRLDALTTESRLKRYLENAARADALCACVTEGYSGDPLKLTQIQGISDLVMKRGYEEKRKLWVAALERAKGKSKTNDVDTFFRQQLELCGYRSFNALGVWTLALPFKAKNQGQVVLSKDAAGQLVAELLWRSGGPFQVEEAKLTADGFELRFWSRDPSVMDGGRKNVIAATVDGDMARCAYYLEDSDGKALEPKRGFVAHRASTAAKP